MPTTPNLSLTYPASTDFVVNGATAMGTIAIGIDNYYGAATTYTPTLGNTTGGAATGRFYKLGKLGFVHVQFTAGTTAAIGNVTATLPSGWSTLALGVQTLGATSGGGLIFASAATGTITITSSAAGATWTAGASVAGIRVTGWVMLA